MEKTVENTEVKKDNPLHKKIKVDAALSALLGGATEISRPEVTKQIWAYIKLNNLQDPKDKRVIVPDALLGAVIGTDAINMLMMTKEINKHFVK